MTKYALLLPFVVGCVGAHHTAAGTTPDGRLRYLIECKRSASNCYERADKLCGGIYDVVGENGGTQTYELGPATSQCSLSGDSASCVHRPASTVDVYSGSLIVVCAR